MTRPVKTCAAGTSWIAVLILMIAAIGSETAHASDILTIKNCNAPGTDLEGNTDYAATITVCTYNGSDAFSMMAAYNAKDIVRNQYKTLTCLSHSNPPKCTVIVMDPWGPCGLSNKHRDLSAGTYFWKNGSFTRVGSADDQCPS